VALWAFWVLWPGSAGQDRLKPVAFISFNVEDESHPGSGCKWLRLDTPYIAKESSSSAVAQSLSSIVLDSRTFACAVESHTRDSRHLAVTGNVRSSALARRSAYALAILWQALSFNTGLVR